MEETTAIIENEKDIYNELKAEQRLRLQRVAVSIPAVFGIILMLAPTNALNSLVHMLLPQETYYYVMDYFYMLEILAISLLLVSGIMFVSIYLQTGFKK